METAAEIVTDAVRKIRDNCDLTVQEADIISLIVNQVYLEGVFNGVTLAKQGEVSNG